MRLVLLGAVYLLFIVFLAYKHYEYPFSIVLGKNSLKKLVVWDVLRNFATLSTSRFNFFNTKGKNGKK